MADKKVCIVLMQHIQSWLQVAAVGSEVCVEINL